MNHSNNLTVGKNDGISFASEADSSEHFSLCHEEKAGVCSWLNECKYPKHFCKCSFKCDWHHGPFSAVY